MCTMQNPVHVCLKHFVGLSHTVLRLMEITDVKILTGSSAGVCVCVCVLQVCMSICVFNENHIRCSLILSSEPWRGGRCFRSAGLWFRRTAPQSAAAAAGDGGGGEGCCRSQRCCQNWSDITSAEPLISTTQHAISNCSQVCFKTRWVDRNKSRGPRTDTCVHSTLMGCILLNCCFGEF